MDDASSGDFQGAIWSALAATDMAQAEAWLRIALGRYPNDPNILGLAARFEQARGNNERASAFWRAAIAAMPPGSSIKSLDYGLVSPPGSYRAPGPGDTRRLLDPRLDPLPTAEKLAPLPSYQRQSSAPASAASKAAAVCFANADDRAIRQPAAASFRRLGYHLVRTQRTGNCARQPAGLCSAGSQPEQCSLRPRSDRAKLQAANAN